MQKAIYKKKLFIPPKAEEVISEEEQRKRFAEMKLAPMTRDWKEYFDNEEDVLVGNNVCKVLYYASLCIPFITCF